MPTAHAIRRWLWRANRVLVLLVLAVWGYALLDAPSGRPMPRLPELPTHVAADRLGPDISFDEMVALVRPFHGWGERVVEERPVGETPSGGRLPLCAFDLVLWIQDPAGPDSILLNSKDPAQSEALYPMEGRPDQGVAIERIERRGRRAFITVRRGEERFTYPVVDVSTPTASDERIVREVPTRTASDERERWAAASETAGRVDVKVLPYFGSDGWVAGARVTGVRHGSEFARAGLRAGDVIVSVDDEPWSSVDRCRARLARERGVRALRILGSADEEVRRLALDS